MFNHAAIMRDAHAIARDLVKLDSACAPRLYRIHLSIGLTEAWRKAKVAKPAPNPIRLAAIRQEIFVQECRNRMDFAKVARLREEAAQLAA
jgi:hypothetical protein